MKLAYNFQETIIMTCHSENWNDWKWQVENSITDIKSIVDLSDEMVAKLQDKYRMLITPYYYSLIDKEDKNCSIKKQIVPAPEELNNCGFNDTCYNLSDSLSEMKFMKTNNLIHRYPDRVLLIVANNCFSYCRFCTRKRLTSKNECYNFDLSSAINYIKNNNQIRDVLISGGDPLVLEDEQLEHIVSSIRSIPHVDVIRIGTRTPVVLPMRITDKLINMLKKYHPIWINTHFNHPKELTSFSINACEKIINAGIPLGNQSVLLKDINDEIETYKELCLGLVKNRIRPYYLYQCDLGSGNYHFITSIDKGLDIMEGLRGYISGFAVPTYVVDAPNGGGKIALDRDRIEKRTDQEIVMRNYLGQVYTYPIL